TTSMWCATTGLRTVSVTAGLQDACRLRTPAVGRCEAWGGGAARLAVDLGAVRRAGGVGEAGAWVYSCAASRLRRAGRRGSDCPGLGRCPPPPVRPAPPPTAAPARGRGPARVARPPAPR